MSNTIYITPTGRSTGRVARGLASRRGQLGARARRLGARERVGRLLVEDAPNERREAAARRLRDALAAELDAIMAAPPPIAATTTSEPRSFDVAPKSRSAVENEMGL